MEDHSHTLISPRHCSLHTIQARKKEKISPNTSTQQKQCPSTHTPTGFTVFIVNCYLVINNQSTALCVNLLFSIAMDTMRREKKKERKEVRVKQNNEAMCTSLTCTAICVKHLCQNSTQVLYHFTLPVSAKLILSSSGSANGCLTLPSLISHT